MSEDKFWQFAFDTIENEMVDRCNSCPYQEKCKALPEEDDTDCASFLRQMFLEYEGRL